MVTTVPAPPVAGVKLAIVGAGASTVKVKPVEVPPPGAGLVTVTAYVPVVATALAGTTAVSCVGDTNVVVRAVPLRSTPAPLTKPVPFTVRVTAPLPATTVAGAKLVMVGDGLGTVTVKAPVLVAVPPGVASVMSPEVAPAGTTNVLVAASTTVKSATATPFRVMAVAPINAVPVKVTVVPTGPLPGVKLVIAGANTGATGAKARPRNAVFTPAVAMASGRSARLGASL
jgi:hypothetical protein